MVISHIRRSKRLAACAALALAAVALLPGRAFAGFTTCTADPIVILSNGVTVTMSSRISADISQVSQVTYTLHVPNGVSVTSVSYDAYGSKESLRFSADQSSGRYSVGTTAQTTTNGNVPVTATTSVSNLGTRSQSGQSGQSLWVTFGD